MLPLESKSCIPSSMSPSPMNCHGCEQIFLQSTMSEQTCCPERRVTVSLGKIKFCVIAAWLHSVHKVLTLIANGIHPTRWEFVDICRPRIQEFPCGNWILEAVLRKVLWGWRKKTEYEYKTFNYITTVTSIIIRSSRVHILPNLTPVNFSTD